MCRKYFKTYGCIIVARLLGLSTSTCQHEMIHCVTTLSIFTDSLFSLLAFWKVCLVLEKNSLLPFALPRHSGYIFKSLSPYYFRENGDLKSSEGSAFYKQIQETLLTTSAIILTKWLSQSSNAQLFALLLFPLIWGKHWGNKEENNISQRHKELRVFLTEMGIY